MLYALMCAILLVSCGLIQEATCSKGEFCLLFCDDSFSSLMTHFPIARHTLYFHEVFLILPQEAHCDFDPNMLVRGVLLLFHLLSKAPAKRSQYADATCRNIVGRNMLRAFSHPATCLV